MILFGLAYGSIGIQQTLSHLVQSGTAAEDQVIAEFGLGEKQSMLTTGLLAFPFGKEGGECGQPFLPAVQYVAGSQRIGQLLEAGRASAFQKGIVALLEIDVLPAHPRRQPVVLIQADSC